MKKSFSQAKQEFDDKYGDYATYKCPISKHLSFGTFTLIHKYLPVLQAWPDPQFVTLTRKAASAHKLKKTIQEIN
jgi:hypothetical protein